MNNNEFAITEFDRLTLRGSTQILKALIPYLSTGEQRMIGIMIRIWELIMTLKFFEKTCIPTKEHCSNANLINNIKQYCTPDNQKTIDMVLNFMNMSELMKVMNTFSEENSSSPLDGLFNGQSDIFPENFSMSNLSNMMNMFQTFTQTNAQPSTNNSDNDSKHTFNNTGFQNTFTQGTTDTSSPDNILKSMMNSSQSDLYEEFMEKLNKTMEN